MRRGQDRFEVGEQVVELLFPDGIALPRGIAVGTPVAEISSREDAVRVEGSAAVFGFALDDPFDNERHLEFRVHQQLGRAHILTAFFTSKDRLDVDSAYRLVRKHLKNAHGKPGQEKTGVLKFVYDVEGGTYPTTISVCRYLADDGRNKLEVSMRAAEGVRFTQQGPG